MRARILAVLPIAAAFALVTTSASDAGFRRLRSHYAPGEVITAYSHYGNGAVSSVVRPGRHGWQVRLPRGAGARLGAARAAAAAMLKFCLSA